MKINTGGMIMKSNKYFFLSALALLTACEKEAVTPQREAVRTETVAVHAENETKGAVDNSTGAFSWNSGSDQIAVWVGDSYTTCTVSGGEVSVELTGEQARSNYAIYPASSAILDGYATPTLTYPTHYTVSGTGFDSQVPMVAVNTAGEELDFYQVGALVRIKIENAPVGTVSAIVSFKNTNVTGTATVSNPGTSSATATITDNAGKNVYFTLSPALSTVSTIYLDVPIPAVDYGTETITVKLFNDSDTWIYSEEKTWNSVARAHAKRISANVTTDGATKADCIPGLFTVGAGAKVLFAKGNLTYGGSTFEIAEHQYDSYSEYDASGLGTKSGSHHFLYTDIFTDGTSSSADNTVHTAYTEGIVALGSQWRLPTADEWKYLTETRSKPGIGGYYSVIYLRGQSRSAVLIYPDGFSAAEWNTVTMGPVPGSFDTPKSRSGTGSNYSDTQVQAMSRVGILVLPCNGHYASGAWTNESTRANYWSATSKSKTAAYRFTMYFHASSGVFNAKANTTISGGYHCIRLAQTD